MGSKKFIKIWDKKGQEFFLFFISMCWQIQGLHNPSAPFISVKRKYKS